MTNYEKALTQLELAKFDLASLQHRNLLPIVKLYVASILYRINFLIQLILKNLSKKPKGIERR